MRKMIIKKDLNKKEDNTNPNQEYFWSDEFNQYIPKVKGYFTIKENK